MKLKLSELRQMIKEELTTSGKSMRKVYYELGDEIYGLADLGKSTKDSKIIQISRNMLKLQDELMKHLNKKYPKWD